MYKNIVKDKTRQQKAIKVLGLSFCEGHGALLLGRHDDEDDQELAC